MCSQYWTLIDIEFTCPRCLATTKDDLQTHFMGEIGSCSNRYELGTPVEELKFISATLGPRKEGYPDDFIGQCGECKTWVDFGAVIIDGKVIKVYPI
jgi:hypothetical protein